MRLPMWAEGTVEGTYSRKSLKTKSWDRAATLARSIEDTANAETAPKDEPITIVQAVTEYLADAKARELADATLYKLEIQLRKQFLTWCKAEGYKLLKEFDLRAAQSFRASWADGGLAKKKKQERLTGFFWFCIRAGWLSANPTDRLGRISVTQAPTDYFTRDEYEKLLDATYLYREGRGETIGGNNGTRIRALIMLMRWSGLRIRDAVTLERTRLINDNLLLYQASGRQWRRAFFLAVSCLKARPSVVIGRHSSGAGGSQKYCNSRQIKCNFCARINVSLAKHSSYRCLRAPNRVHRRHLAFGSV
jgi:integrase/recombinase XerD